ncbi:MAG: hypothetical protein HKO56_08870 [Bacteroidia bacterium]|nr:hypothetical protein [Bacteroidia bacterium]
MSKIKYILTCIVALGFISTASFAQTAKSCFVIPDKDNNQKITVDEAISWAETVPVVVTCDNEQMYTLYSFDISIFQRKPLMTRGFGTGIQGVPLMALNGIKNAKAGDTVILQNVVCKGDDGNDLTLPMISFELEAGSEETQEEMDDGDEDDDGDDDDDDDDDDEDGDEDDDDDK